MTAIASTVMVGIAVLIAHFLSPRWHCWFFCRRTCSCGNSCENCKARWDTFRDLKWERDKSPLLYAMATLLFLLRRLSLWENFKHCFKSPAPWALEAYLFIWWVGILSIPWWGSWRDDPPACFRWIALFVVVQILQTNFYHGFWRTLGEDLSDEETERRKVFNRMRNLIIAIANVFFVNRLFGAFYWWSAEKNNFSEMPKNIGDAFYFSTVTGSTLGYGEIRPSLDADLIQTVVLFQILSSLFLVAVVLSMAVGAIPALKQKSHVTNRASDNEQLTRD